MTAHISLAFMRMPTHNGPMHQRDVIRELGKQIESKGEKAVAAALVQKGVGMRTVQYLVSGQYKRQPRGLLLIAITEVVDALSEKAP